MKLKIGMIGTNFISDKFALAALQIPGAELYAICSRRKETGAAFAEKYKIPNVFTDYQEFLNSDLDAVYIATPNALHCEQTLQALEHRKHVLCEKIMAINEEEVRSMIDCAKKNHVVLLEAMRPDFDPAFSLVDEQLPKIGQLRRVVFEYCQYSSRYDNFRNGEILNAFNPALGNAAVMDIGVYCIHSLVRFLGMPDSIQSSSVKLSNGFEGAGTVLMKYADFTAEAVYSKISVSVTPSTLQGEDGSVLIDQISTPHHMEVRLRKGCRDTLDGGIIQPIEYTPLENNMVFEIREFLRLIEEKEINHKYLQYSLDTIRVIDEVRRQNQILF